MARQCLSGNRLSLLLLLAGSLLGSSTVHGLNMRRTRNLNGEKTARSAYATCMISANMDPVPTGVCSSTLTTALSVSAPSTHPAITVSMQGYGITGAIKINAAKTRAANDKMTQLLKQCKIVTHADNSCRLIVRVKGWALPDASRRLPGLQDCG